MPYVEKNIERVIQENPAKQEPHNFNAAAKRYSMQHNYVAGIEKAVDAMTAQGIVWSYYVMVKAKASDKSCVGTGLFAFRFWKGTLQWAR